MGLPHYSDRRYIGTAVLLLGMCIIALSLPASASDTAAPAKIAPSLASQTALGGSSEALIVFSEQADLSGAANLKTKLEKGQYVYNALRAVAERTQAPMRKMLQERGIPFQSFYGVNMIKLTASRNLLYELAGNNEVRRIEANPKVRSSIPVPNLTLPTTHNSTQQSLTTSQVTGTIEWNVAKVNAPQVWAMGFHGEGMVIANADTGVLWDHIALKSHYRGWNGTAVDHSYSWHDATSDHSLVPIDPNFHGTFTMSEMVGDDGLGNQVGVAPGTKFIACRNMDRHGIGSPAQYIECFQFLIAPYPMGHPELANPAMAPDVINNSWDCPASEGCSLTTLQAIEDAVTGAGIFQSMAAGNYGPSCSTVKTTPAIYSSGVSVGATTSYNTIAGFSRRGPVTVDGSDRLKPELVAPGYNIRAAIPYLNMYQGYWQGTSMAAPHVAAGVALLWQARPALNGQIAATTTQLTKTAFPLTSTQSCSSLPGSAVPNAVFGYGLLDILKAVQTP
ncbi:MAG TPA: S8 family serine peptidase [Terriglobales bacterium]